MNTTPFPVDVSARTMFVVPVTFEIVARRNDADDCIIVSMTPAMDVRCESWDCVYRDDMSVDAQIDMHIDRIVDTMFAMSDAEIDAFTRTMRGVVGPLRPARL